MTERTSASLGKLRTALRLLSDSIESYERNGARTADKLESDLLMTARACWDVAIQIARRA